MDGMTRRISSIGLRKTRRTTSGLRMGLSVHTIATGAPVVLMKDGNARDRLVVNELAIVGKPLSITCQKMDVAVKSSGFPWVFLTTTRYTNVPISFELESSLTSMKISKYNTFSLILPSEPFIRIVSRPVPKSMPSNSEGYDILFQNREWWFRDDIHECGSNN